MKSPDRMEAIATKFTLSEFWEREDPPPADLWTSPSSPPYNNSRIHPSLSTNQRTSAEQSSPASTPSEFEFNSLATAEVRDEPPVSPKFLSSFATGYWAAIESSQERDRIRAQIPSLHGDAASSIYQLRDDHASTAMAGSPVSKYSRKQPSTPSSHSVRQLITEEMRGGEHADESDLDFYSAPQTPAARSRPLSPKHGPEPHRPLSQGHESSAHREKHLISSHGAPLTGRRKSKSAASDRRNLAQYLELATMETNSITPSKSEPHASFRASASSSATNAWDKSEEEKNNVLAAKKANSSSKSTKKWAFKDLLRRTVPSSKADAHYVTKTLAATSSSRSLFSNPRSAPISPQSSPLRSYIDSTSRPPTLQAARPSSRTPRSPPHRALSAHGRSPVHSLDTHAPQYSSTSSRTPAPSPPRSPLSPHVAHYKLQKAQSQELGRKTFLPYRQSLLGCLGGSRAFSDQLVW